MSENRAVIVAGEGREIASLARDVQLLINEHRVSPGTASRLEQALIVAGYCIPEG